MNNGASFLTLSDRALAYQQWRAAPSRQNAPGVIFLGGFASDMTGTKASFLSQMAQKEGLAFVRFDYRGHGLSSGKFETSTLGDWLDDALTIFDRLTTGPQIVIGSSMGGWLGLLLARARPDRLRAFIGISAAPDFTKDLIEDILTPEQKQELDRRGYILDPTAPPEHQVPITKKLIEEGRNHLLLPAAPIKIPAPVCLLQGQKDQEVPWKHALRVAEAIESPDVRLCLIKDGAHSLSRPDDLTLLWHCVLMNSAEPFDAS